MLTTLDEFFKNLRNRKIVFVGLGNMFYGDDVVGCYIVEELNKKILNKNIYFFDTGTIVENYINKIIKLNAEVIIFIDAIRNKDFEFNYCVLVKEETKNYTFSTHNISLYTIIEYLYNQQYVEYKTKPEIYVLGIKVNLLDFVEKMSEKTKNIADEVIKIIYSSLN